MSKSICNTIIIIAIAVTFSAVATAQTITAAPAPCLPVNTVTNFNVTAYASAPWYVQQQATNAYTPLESNRCVTAQYTVRDESQLSWWEKSLWGYTIDVFNYAETTETDNSGSRSSSGGSLCADYDETTPSKLTVAPCWLPQWIGGPYWVVSYREGQDNGYALVSGGTPGFLVAGEETGCGVRGADPCCKTGEGINRSGLWILTRQRNPPEVLVAEVRGVASRLGFSTSVLFNVTHDSECHVPGIDDNDESSNVRFLR